MTEQLIPDFTPTTEVIECGLDFDISTRLPLDLMIR